MNTVISKYPIRVGDVIIPAGSVGEIVEINEMQQYFPNILYKGDSNQVAVKFLELKPCIVHTSQVTFQHE